MEKIKIKFNEVYFGNNSVENQYKLQLTIHELKHQKCSIFKLPLRVTGILFIFGQQMFNNTVVDLEYITVILFNRWLAY